MILWYINLNWLTWSVALISTYSQKAYPLDSDVALSFTRLKALRGPNDVRSSLTCTTVEDAQVCEHNSSCSSNPIHILSIEPRMGVYKMAGPIERNSGFWKLKSHSLSPKRNRDFFKNNNVAIQCDFNGLCLKKKNVAEFTVKTDSILIRSPIRQVAFTMQTKITAKELSSDCLLPWGITNDRISLPYLNIWIFWEKKKLKSIIFYT